MKSKHFFVLAAVAFIATMSFAMDLHAALNELSTVAASNIDPMLLGSAGMFGMLGATMQKVHYTNETDKFQHVGGVTVPPGETREVDASLLPGYQPEAEAAPAPTEDPVAALLKGTVKEITGALPVLSDEDLGKAAALEQDGQNRKSLLAAMQEEALRRAAAKDEADATARAAAAGQGDTSTDTGAGNESQGA